MTEPDEALLWARDHELRSLLAAASPGPWHHVNAGKVSRKTRTVHGTVPAEPIDYVSTWPGLGTPPGHRVIVHREAGARTADLALIAEAPALASEVLNLRAGQAASAERIKALEEENAALEEMAGNLQVRMSDMLERLEERYPEDFVWLTEEPAKEADQ
jgi:hypothetical protein